MYGMSLPALIVAGIIACGFIMADFWGKAAFIAAGIVIVGMAG